MLFKLNEEIPQAEWKEFIENHPNGNIFQHPLMYNFLKTQSGFNVYAFAYYEKELLGTVLVIIQKSFFNLLNTRAIIYGGPIISNDSNSVLKILLNKIVCVLRNKVIYIEIRNFNDTKNNLEIFRNNKFEFAEHLNILVPIKGREDINRKINKGKLRQIKKSLQLGCEIVESDDEREIKEFYLVLKNLYKTKVHKPLPAWEFFNSFRVEKELGKYFLIKYKNDIVGGIMCPIYKNEILYEWYIAGKNNIENIYTSVLATWAPLNFAIDNNLQYFDFMGAGKPNEDYGVRDFKLQFGGEIVNYGRYTRINNRLIYWIGKLYIEKLNHVFSKNKK